MGAPEQSNAAAPPGNWYAIDLDRGRTIVFSPEPPPPAVLTALRTELGGRPLDGVALEVPESDTQAWPLGADCPEVVLTYYESEPRRFRVFRFRRDIPSSGFVKTGKNYAVINGSRQWEIFLDSIRRLDAIASKASPNETPDEWDILRQGLEESLANGRP